MQLSDLLAAVPEARVLSGTAELPITQLCYDSREAQAGALFIALHGLQRDGHDYAAAAVDTAPWLRWLRGRWHCRSM